MSKSDHLSAETREQLSGRRGGSDAHDAWRHTGCRPADDPGKRLQAEACHRIPGGDEDRRRAVVDARGVASGDAATVPERRLQCGELLERSGAWMLVLLDGHRLAPTLGDLDRDDLLRQSAGLLGAGRPLL